MARAASPFAAHDHRACIDRALAAAQAECAARGLQLTAVRRRVLEILLESHVSMGAYEVLARLSEDGRPAQPPTAYRALAFLVDNGFAHRVERLNAYVACARPGAHAHDPAFLICTGCGTVAEAEATAPPAADGFRVDHLVSEAEGLCPACQSREAGA